MPAPEPAGKGLGAKPSALEVGDGCDLIHGDNNEFLETYFGSAKIGAVLVPLNTRLAPPELDFMLGDVGATEFIYGQAFEDKVKKMAYPNGVRHRICSGASALENVTDYDGLLARASDKEPPAQQTEEEEHGRSFDDHENKEEHSALQAERCAR